LTPWLERYVALRWFAGYYNFNNSYGSDIGGLKGRAEIRFSQKLAIDATYYADEEITGSNWLFGIRMTIPIFMENLADGRSPFQGSFSGMFDGVNMGNRNRESAILRGGAASTYPSSTALSPFAAMAPAPSFASASRKGSTVRDRMTEQTLRLSSGARTSQSGFIEDPNKRRVNTETKTKTRVVVINDSIVFVDNGRGTLGGPGTFENPLSGIQGGVNRASVLFGNRGDVFVAGTATTYTEDVVDAGSSVKIWGGGRGIPANGGRRFTSGSQPVLDGGFQITSVPLFSLSGFTIRNGFGGAGDGVNVNDTSSVVIEYNDISASGFDAVQVVSTNGTININNNVLHNSALGLNVDVTADSEMTATTMIANNQFLNNTGNGMNLNIDSDDGSTTNTTITNNVASGNGGIGFNISIDVEDNAPNGGGMLTIQGNTANGNTSDGLRLDLDADDMGGRAFVVNIFDNQFLNSVGGEGINIDLDIDGNPNDSTVVLTISGNRIAGNALDGLNLNADVNDTNLVSFAILNNQFLNNGGDGFELSLDADESISINISGNSFMTHGGDSIALDLGGSSGPVDFFSTLDNTSAGAGSGNALGDNGTSNATGFIILDGATINFPNPGDIPD
ncbi:MAG: right-handed parallel beta-helix repeat-containing protein, partial [Verrucomicrobiota bacterium]